MADQPDNDPLTKVFRTRKSDLISGITVCIAVPVAFATWHMRNELQGIIDSQTTTHSVRVDKLRDELRESIALERERAVEQERELKADVRELRTQVLRLKSYK